MKPFYLADPATRDWVHRIYSVLEHDGSALVMGLGTPHPERRPTHGISDNCYAADRILDWLVDAGWIIPVSYNPSLSQRFFGVGGRAPGRSQRKPVWRASHTYPQEWRYRVNQDIEPLKAFIRTGATPGVQTPVTKSENLEVTEGEIGSTEGRPASFKQPTNEELDLAKAHLDELLGDKP